MRLVSAVFMKELVTLARGKRHFFARGLLLSALVAVIWMAWEGAEKSMRYSNFMDTSSMGYELFTIFMITQLIAVVILTPALTAPVIASEKDRDTLGLLMMTNLGRGHILLDKVLSRVCLMLLLLLSGLPLFLALLAFGGITPGEIYQAYMCIFGTILFCSGFGLLFSTGMNKMHTALMATYAAMAAYLFGVIYLKESWHFRQIIYWALPIGFFDPNRRNETACFFALSLVVFLLSFLGCYRMLPRITARKKRSGIRRLFHWMNDYFHRINFTGVVLMDDNRALDGNAILWKETHKHIFSSNTFLIRASYALVILSFVVLITMCSTYDVTDIVPFLIVIGGMLVGAMTVISSSVAFTSEREKHSFEILMSSPLTARAVVLAKFIGVLKSTLPILGFVVLWMGVASFICGEPPSWRRYGWSDQHAIRRFLLLAVSYLPMLTAIGLYSSAKRQRTGTAILQTFLICLAWTLVSLVPPFFEIFDYLEVPDELIFTYLSMSPIPSMITFLVSPNNFCSWACACVIPCWIGLLAILIHRFDRIVGRQ